LHQLGDVPSREATPLSPARSIAAPAGLQGLAAQLTRETSGNQPDTERDPLDVRSLERQHEHEKLRRKIEDLRAERELLQLRAERDKARALIEQGNKPTRARSSSLEVLANPPPPKRVAIEEQWDRVSALLPDRFHGKDMQELAKFLHVCNKIFRCNSPKYASENNRIHYSAQFLVGSVDTAWEQHLESADPASITWKGFKKFLANQVATPGMRQVDVLA
jgi:hypothetical protein